MSLTVLKGGVRTEKKTDKTKDRIGRANSKYCAPSLFLTAVIYLRGYETKARNDRNAWLQLLASYKLLSSFLEVRFPGH